MAEKRSIRWQEPTVLLAISLFVIWFFYSGVLLSPNSFLFSDSGDGLTSYYNASYHIRYDTSLVEFNGMNYPYSEQITYSVSNPFLTSGLKIIATFFPAVSDYSVGITNLSLLLSLVLLPLFIYLILIQFKTNRVLAVLAAIGISILSPQIFRFSGHLSLGYGIFFPLSWYLLLKQRASSRKLIWNIILLVNTTIWFFVHPYLGMMVLFFSLVYWILDYLIEFSERFLDKENYVLLLFSILFPLVVFVGFVALTDTHFQRSIHPSGFFSYNAEPDDVFLPNHPPLQPLLASISPIKQQWEAWSYVGLTSILAIITFFILAVRKLLRPKNSLRPLDFFSDQRLRISLYASCILLLFAFAIPFRQFRFLVEWVPMLKQFRTTGRFAWVFFYVITIGAAYFINNITLFMMKNRQKILGHVLIIVLPLGFLAEGISYHSETAQAICKSPNLFQERFLSEDIQQSLKLLSVENYEAILPLPYYYGGSGVFSSSGTQSSILLSQLFSYHTGLPICGFNVGRGSIQESKNMVQLMSPDYYRKAIQKDFPLNRKLLVVCSNEQLSHYEMAVLEKCKMLRYTPKHSIYELNPSDLFSSSASSKIETFQKSLIGLSPKSEFLTDDTTGFLYYTSFEDKPEDISFSGNGAYRSMKGGKNIYAWFDKNTFEPNVAYHVSAWMNNSGERPLNNWFRFIVEEYDTETDSLYQSVALPEFSQVIDGDWSLVELEFEIRHPNNTIAIITLGKEDEPGEIILDDLFISKGNTNVYKVVKMDGNQVTELFWNNQRITVW